MAINSIKLFFHFCRQPHIFLIGMMGVSVCALAGAYIAQYGFGLEPCALCLYQRIPFMVVIGVALASFTFYKLGPFIPCWAIAICALAFVTNALIAGHHSGVEQGWWESILNQCGGNTGNTSLSQADLLARIMTAPVIRCDEVPWVDPVFGLSMAAYNTILCICMSIFCIFGFHSALQRSRQFIHK